MNKWRKVLLGSTALLFAVGNFTYAEPLPGGTLDPTTIPKYVTPLVIPPVMKDTAGDNTTDEYEIAVREFRQQILPGGIWNTINGRDDKFNPTRVWSYGPAADVVPQVAPAADSQFNYPAYTIETLSNPTNNPANYVNVRWINDLVDDKGKYLNHLLPVDQTVHWANPPQECRDGTTRTDCAGTSDELYEGPVPLVTHLHGAHVEGDSDGYPEAWWLPAAKNIPKGYATEGRLFDDAYGQPPQNSGYVDFQYPNDQPATTLWYHDHTLGMTRLNVYAGPAGFWLIRGGANDMVDDTTTGTAWDGVLPGPAPIAGQGVLELNVPGDPVRDSIREIPVVIQDRSFDVDGKLFYPKFRAFFEGIDKGKLKIDFASFSDVLPHWQPEAFFNVMVVNGVSWPELEVAPAQYRLRFLNGCSSRFLWLKFGDSDVEAYQIGAEQGFLPGPVDLNTLDLDESGDGTAQILLGLAERADVLVDFRGLEDGTVIELLNIGPDEPFGGGIPGVDFDPADPETTGQVMRFVVNSDLNGESETDPLGATPATDPTDLALNKEGALGALTNFQTRNVSLNERVSEEVCVLLDVEADAFIEPIRQVPCDMEDPDGTPDSGIDVVPFGPTEALLGQVSGSGVGASGIPLKWTDEGGPDAVTKKIVLNNNQDGIPVTVTENPDGNAVEEWEIYNFTADAHPIHLHLVRFEVLERKIISEESPNFDGGNLGATRGPEPWEEGFKDTVISYPGETTTIKAYFDIEGLYVWHCHIIEHEDNEMMRPYVVGLDDWLP